VNLSRGDRPGVLVGVEPSEASPSCGTVSINGSVPADATTMRAGSYALTAAQLKVAITRINVRRNNMEKHSCEQSSAVDIDRFGFYGD
jgi:hypothetical protein